jgi:hypothetical protein
VLLLGERTGLSVHQPVAWVAVRRGFSRFNRTARSNSSVSDTEPRRPGWGHERVEPAVPVVDDPAVQGRAAHGRPLAVGAAVLPLASCRTSLPRSAADSPGSAASRIGAMSRRRASYIVVLSSLIRGEHAQDTIHDMLVRVLDTYIDGGSP